MKKLLFWLLAVITFPVALAYLASCLTPYISPVYFEEMPLLALGFPYLFVSIFFLALLWIFIRRKTSLILFTLLLVGYQNLTATFAFNFAKQKTATKDSNSLRILGWNIRQFNNPTINIDSPTSARRQMIDYISRSDADVLCLQEFGEHYIKFMLSNTTELIDIGYHYYYRTNETVYRYPYGTVLSGTAIFSKIPLLNAGKIMLGDSGYPEHLAFVDVMLNGKPLRIFATHFKSLNLFIGGYDPNNKVVFYGDSTFVYNSTKIEKIKKFGQAHAREALIAKAALNNSQVPFIFSGDLNSVPASFAYHTMSKGLQDAYLQHGFGLGTTLDSLPKTLRIDYLLADKRVAIKYYHKDTLHLSDHFPQMIDVTWKK